MSVLGNPLSALQRLSGYPRFSDDGQLTVTEKHVCLFASVSTLMPARGTVHPDYADYVLKKRGWERDGESAIVTLEYGLANVVGTGAYPMPDGAEVLSTRATVDVETADDGTELLVPGIIYTRRRVKTVWPDTAATRTLNVGTLINPPGLTSPGANEWLKTGRSVDQASDGTLVEDEYKWRSGGWDTAKYAAGAGET